MTQQNTGLTAISTLLNPAGDSNPGAVGNAAVTAVTDATNVLPAHTSNGAIIPVGSASTPVGNIFTALSTLAPAVAGSTDYDKALTLQTGTNGLSKLFTPDRNAVNAHFSPAAGALTNTVIGSVLTPNTATGEFNPAAIATTAAGNYFNPLSWTGTLKLTGTPSSFTLTDTADGGKTVTLTENIAGSPFANGNGAVNQTLTFKGANNDTLVSKYAVDLKNVPATINANNTAGASLDVHNENYAESYSKSAGKDSISSNYSTAQTHKFVESNGNQALRDAFAENYAYKDAGLTISSSVKSALGDDKNLNGAERIEVKNAANYHYATTPTTVTGAGTGTIDYSVSDNRNLVRTDERTFTNTTITNVAKYSVTDTSVAGNTLKVVASGVITGVTKDHDATKFTATNATFTVDNINYSLKITDFTTQKAVTGENVLSNLVSNNIRFNDGAALTTNIKNVTPATLASAKYFVGTTFTGTEFAETIKINNVAVKDAAGKDTAVFVGGNVNAGAGDDIITGSKGDDTIDGGAGKDSITLTDGGSDEVVNFKLGEDSLTVPKGTGITKVSVVFADGNSADYIVNANSAADIVIPATKADKTLFNKMDLDALAADPKSGVAQANPFDFSKSTDAVTTVVGTAGNDSILGGSGSDSLKGGDGIDTIIGNAGNDTLDGQQGNDSLVGNAGNDSLIGGRGADFVDGGEGFDTYTPASSINATGSGKAFDGTTTVASNIDFENANSAGTQLTAKAGATVQGTVSGFVVNLGATDLALADITKATTDIIAGKTTSDIIGGLVVKANTSAELFASGSLTNSITDTLVSIENVTGSPLNDYIIGSADVNVITGGNGVDTLTGGLGADIFAYTTKTVGAFKAETGGAGVDKITDFKSGEDKIQLTVDLGNAALVKAVGGVAYVPNDSLKTTGTAIDFVTTKINAGATTAVTANPTELGRFIFDSATKTLWFDAKGDDTVSAAGVVFYGTAPTTAAPTADDFQVVQLTGTSTALAATDFIFA